MGGCRAGGHAHVAARARRPRHGRGARRGRRVPRAPAADASTRRRAVWPLVVRRALVLEAGAERVLAADPDNEYALARRPFERLVLGACARGAVRRDRVADPRRRGPAAAVRGALDADDRRGSPTPRSLTSRSRRRVHDGGAWLVPAGDDPSPECVTAYAACPMLLPEAATAESRDPCLLGMSRDTSSRHGRHGARATRSCDRSWAA